MKWDFTPEDILNGRARYSVAQFRGDLLKELRDAVGQHRDGEKLTQFYAIITVMLCTSLALGKSTNGFVASVKKYFPSRELQEQLTKRELIDQIQDSNKENIEMLRAVISRRMKDDMSIGIEPDCITRTITSELMTF
ncbi:MAG: hypothetical protein EPN25_09280 [Nitrospirae bacterium]|nr:MAG: hypothetical protein EPN25_09280 [Nitrospirota bacterium]